MSALNVYVLHILNKEQRISTISNMQLEKVVSWCLQLTVYLPTEQVNTLMRRGPVMLIWLLMLKLHVTVVRYACVTELTGTVGDRRQTCQDTYSHLRKQSIHFKFTQTHTPIAKGILALWQESQAASCLFTLLGITWCQQFPVTAGYTLHFSEGALIGYF